MSTRTYVFFFLILTACNSKPAKETVEIKSADSSTIVQINQRPVAQDSQRQVVDDIRLDTLKINKQKFIRAFKDGRFYCLLSLQGDTVITSEDYYFRADILDINKDGYKDIRVFIFCNTPNTCDNYMYDKELKTFRLLENAYLDIQKIKGTDFYYTYNRAGCSDMNWESHLSKIEDYKLIVYGYIYGKSCDSPEVIRIYRVHDNSETDDKELIKELPYHKHIREFSEKFDFIKRYWARNWRKFEQ